MLMIGIILNKNNDWWTQQLQIPHQLAALERRYRREGFHLRPQPQDDGQPRQVQQQRHLHQVAAVRGDPELLRQLRAVLENDLCS